MSDPRGLLRGMDGIFLAILASLLAATLGVNAMPMLVGSVSNSMHVNAANAGLLASWELGSVAFSCLVLANKVSHLPRHAMGIVGGIVAAAGHGAVWLIPLLPDSVVHMQGLFLNDQRLSPAFLVVAVTRILAGTGEGIVLAAFSAAVASTAAPERIYARALIVSVSLIGLLMATLLPWMTAQYSYFGTFSSLAGVTLLCTLFMAKLPHSAASGDSRLDAVGNKVHGLLLVISLAIYAAGEGATWTFTERIGVSIGLDYRRIGSIIGSASTVGVCLGAGLAAVIGTRIGRSVPLNAGLATFGAATFMLTRCSSETAYIGLIGLSITSLYFLLPYYLGSASALDNLGRWASASAGMYLLGNTVGPIVAGRLIVDTGSFHTLGWLVLVTCAVPLVMMAPVLRKLAIESDRGA